MLEYFNVLQNRFEDNKENCFNASVMGNYSTNVLKRKMTLEEVLELERLQYENYVMPQQGGGLRGSIGRISKLTRTRSLRRLGWDDMFQFYLNKGLLISVNIIPTDVFIDQWKNSPIITCGSEGKQMSTAHSVNVGKDIQTGKLWMVNQREGPVAKEVVSLDTGLFKTRDWRGLLLPN